MVRNRQPTHMVLVSQPFQEIFYIYNLGADGNQNYALRGTDVLVAPYLSCFAMGIAVTLVICYGSGVGLAHSTLSLQGRYSACTCPLSH